MPSSRARSGARSRASSRPTAKPESSGHGYLCSARLTTSLSTSSLPSPASRKFAIRSPLTTRVGPVTTPSSQYKKILASRRAGRAEGAQWVLGGRSRQGAVWRRLVCRDRRRRHRQANNTPYGLATGVWTGASGGRSSCRSARASALSGVNTYRTISIMSLFGGYKRSGLGRASGSHADGSAGPVCQPMTTVNRNTGSSNVCPRRVSPAVVAKVALAFRDRSPHADVSTLPAPFRGYHRPKAIVSRQGSGCKSAKHCPKATCACDPGAYPSR
jgi:Aldehyde dehydrogenase family